jgi:hypothetical protein
MADQETILRVQKAVLPKLMAQPGVTGVGVGPREQGGKLTDEVVIRVYVQHKRPPGEVPPELRIPAEIEGVKTDVIQKGPDVHAGTGGYRQRPIVSGLEITRVKPWVKVEQGTIGCFVTKPKLTDEQRLRARQPNVVTIQTIYLLSASHVLNPGDTVDNVVYQPNAPFGYIDRVADTKTDTCRYGGALDAGLALLDNDMEWKNDVHNVGTIQGVRRAVKFDKVWKQGRTTGITSGTVTDDSYYGWFPGKTAWFGPGLQVTSDVPFTDFGAAGDSGSLIFVKDQTPQGEMIIGVGLMVMITEGDGRFATACHLDTVFGALGVEFPLATKGRAPRH